MPHREGFIAAVVSLAVPGGCAICLVNVLVVSSVCVIADISVTWMTHRVATTAALPYSRYVHAGIQISFFVNPL